MIATFTTDTPGHPLALLLRVALLREAVAYEAATGHPITITQDGATLTVAALFGAERVTVPTGKKPISRKERTPMVSWRAPFLPARAS